MKKHFFWGILTLALVMTSCGSGADEAKDKLAAAAAQKKPLVKVALSVEHPVDQVASFTGSILPFAQNNISPSMGLRIEKIHVDVGDKVSKGQVLVEMDKRQYLQSAVQTSLLETDYLRLKKLYEEGGVSKQQLDQLETQLSVSRHATDNLAENTDLISPISGVVTERSFDPGDIYSPGAGRILTVMQINKVKVQINVSEQYFTQVKLGMPVDIKLDVYPDKSFEGRVSLIYPALDAATRTFTVEITIANPSSELRPGMFCRVTLNFGETERVLVPDIAVQKQVGTNERYLFTVKDGIATRHTVNLGRVVDKNYEILSGVEAGEQVVIAGGQKLLDGTQVEVSK